ncbi:phosphatidylglycerol lysyltransferase domain-containing protein [Roseomonas elaeocarpi]|uniref:Phosphatidylglycerol lysyltransferase domain-containing protein n=1 Tax=Roseomonas elaeocarpi TaxID=907779 RepID=A0ABV6JQF5_9PROT
MTIPPALRKHGPTAFGLLLLVGALYVVQRELRDLKLSDVLTSLQATPSHTIWMAAGWTLLAYAVLTIYDRLGSVYAGKPISYSRTALASFCAYTLAHNIGFAAVSGAAVRYRFYAAWGLTPQEIAKVIAFTSLTFGLGGFALGGIVLMTNPEVLGWVGPDKLIPNWAAHIVALVMWAVVGTYIVLARLVPHLNLFGHKVDLPGLRLAVAQVLLASVDVAVTAMIFYVLLPEGQPGAPPLTFLAFLGIYVAGYTAGLASNVPGGLGVFDSFILTSLASYVPLPQAVGALFLFRLFYYIIPLFLAAALFVGFELGQRRPVMRRLQTEARVADTLEAPVIAALTALAGLVLLFIGSLPTGREGIASLGRWASLGNQFAASVVGSLLLVVAWGLLRRLTLAWYSGLLLLAVSAGILFLRGDPWLVIVALAAILVLLAIMRRSFYRHARLTSEPLKGSRVFSIAAGVLCCLALAALAHEGRVSTASWWQVVLSGHAPTSLRFAIVATVTLLLLAALRLLRPARTTASPYDEAARSRLIRLGARHAASAAGSNLGAVFSEDGKAGLAFRRYEDVWLGQGDPEGESHARAALVWRFKDLCDAAGVEPAFADIGKGLQRTYEDAGLTVIPLPGGRALACRTERDPQRIIALVQGGQPG